VDANGNRYIGGSFSHVILKNGSKRGVDEDCDDQDNLDHRYDDVYRGVLAKNLVKLKSDGTVDFEFLNRLKGTNGTVRSIAISGQEIYIGGDFVKVSTVRANHIAKLDSSGQINLSFSPSKGPNGTDRSIYALVATSDAVFAGGEFNSYRDGSANGLVKISPNGAQDPQFAAACQKMNGAVHALALAKADSSLYVGGTFTTLGGIQISSLAEVSTSTGQVNPGFHPSGLDDDIDALAVDPTGRGVYVGGRDRGYHDRRQHNLVRVTLNGGLDATFKAQLDGNILAVAVDSTGDRIYVGGSFLSVNGQTVNGIALLNANGAVSTQFLPSSGRIGVSQGKGVVAHPEVDALAIDGASLLIGGNFSSYRDMTAFDYAEVRLDGLFVF
jgi:hypothetical protein